MTTSLPLATLFGLAPTTALVVLFVLLPVVAGAVIVPLYAWRTSGGPKPVLTSEILATGTPAEAQILSVRTLGSILDVRPMVRFLLEVTPKVDDEPFELEVVQSFPRQAIHQFKTGDTVEIRLTADRTAGAVLWREWG